MLSYVSPVKVDVWKNFFIKTHFANESHPVNTLSSKLNLKLYYKKATLCDAWLKSSCP